jgi:carboxymethylenebutenolidase
MQALTKHILRISIGLGTVLALFGAESAAAAQALPPDAEGALARLDASPRHGEWVTYDAGGGDMVRAWVTYPERSDPAPVVVVIHEIFGMTDWVRSVADQLSADGFIAIAPDLLSGAGTGGGGSETLDQQASVAAIQTLDRADVNRRLRAAAAYGTALPSATDRVGAVGYCWGGSTSFLFAVDFADLDAAVVYYGGAPEDGLGDIRAPVLGLYGGDDNRVNSSIPRAEQAMSGPRQSFEPHIFDGAGHGFLRAQSGKDGANMRATSQAWPLTIDFFRTHLGDSN